MVLVILGIWISCNMQVNSEVVLQRRMCVRVYNKVCDYTTNKKQQL